jgi:HSP20 family molecular chaperone IbpA
MDTHSIRAGLNHVGDPYYNLNGYRSHRNLLAPKFDVFEAAGAYYLVGEIPGITAKRQVTYEWLADQTLFIRGHIDPLDLEAGWKSTQTSDNSETTENHVTQDMKNLRAERHVGDFERSFTFPTIVDTENMEAELEGGLLKIKISKR